MIMHTFKVQAAIHQTDNGFLVEIRDDSKRTEKDYRGGEHCTIHTNIDSAMDKVRELFTR